MPFDTTQNPRQLAADVLRNTTKKQGVSDLYRDGAYCALGVLGSEILGIPDDKLCGSDWTKIAAVAGVSADEIWERNDGAEGHKPHTFAEIANWLESLDQ